MTINPLQKIETLNDLIIQCDISSVDNFHLQLNKGIKVDKEKNEDKKEKGDKKESEKENKKEKYKLKIDINEFKDIAKNDKFKNCYDFTKKQNYLIEKFASQGYEISKYRFVPFNKIIVGLGQESVREVSMTLHWIYGIPYIPGQAIKGTLSNWIKKEGPYDEEENFKSIFGTENNKGNVIFMDSYPEDWNFKLSLDIMNPHYPEYYTGNIAPADWQNPNPIFFLTLQNVKFRINLIYLEKDVKNLKIGERTLEEWLKEALQYGGVGAKTALGYGKGKLIPAKGD